MDGRDRSKVQCKTRTAVKRQQLNVLIWKLFTQRRVYCWSTMFEIIEGCLVFLVLFLAKQTLPLRENPTDKIKVLRSDVMITTNKIFYSPHNNFTDILMKKVEEELNNNPDYGLPSKIFWKLDRKYVFFDDSQFSNISNNNVVFVNFLDSGTSRTHNFSYVIKMFKDEPNREYEKSSHGIFRAIPPPDETADSFLGPIQWAIDKSYIEQLADRNIIHNLKLVERTPYITSDLATLHEFIKLCTIYAPLPFFLYKTSSIIASRTSGLRAIVRISGVSANIIRISHLLESVAMGTLYGIIITVLLKVTSKPILPYSGCAIIVITIILYFMNITALAFVTTTLCYDYNHAHSVALLVYLSTCLFAFVWTSIPGSSSFLWHIIICILPHAPIHMFWEEVVRLEALGVGAVFSNIFKKQLGVAVLKVWLFLCVHLLFLMALEWYMDLVVPTKYGINLPWDFIFKKSFLGSPKKRVHFHVTAEKERNIPKMQDECYFEDGPRDAYIAIKIANVTKEFHTKEGKLVALDDVCLDVYRGEVTILLGQSGSGKSILMSIITGMHAATSGVVYVNGLDNVHRIESVRESVAICPQRSIVFTNLTLKENIKFFEKLTIKNGIMTADVLMEELNMNEKANFFPNQLSKGLLRCLQVACALVCVANVLILDDPTSAMDIDMRHRFWQLIMRLRGQKTILITTMFLEEADAMGDRIAILHKGKLQCHGSPAFLKQVVCGGLTVSITLKHDADKMKLYKLVENTIPGSKYRVNDNLCVSFVLPMIHRRLIPELFNALDAKKSELAVTLIDVGMVMEEIFLEFCDKTTGEDIILPFSYQHFQTERLEGYKRIQQQFMVLIQRIYTNLWKKKYQFLILQVLIPIIGILVITLTTNLKGRNYFKNKLASSYPRMLFDLGPYRRSGLTKGPNMYGLRSLFSDEDLYKTSRAILSENNIGLKMSENSSTLMVPSDPFEVAKSVNLFSNLYLDIQVPNYNKSIIINYEPVQRLKTVIVQPKSMLLCIIWCIWIVFLSILTVVPLFLLAIGERNMGSRGTHTMAGCSPIVHWMSRLMAHFSIYMAIIPTPVLFAALCLDFDNTFHQVGFLGAVLLLLILFGLSFLAHLYFLSFILEEDSAISQVYIMSLGYGILIPVLVDVMKTLGVKFSWLMGLYRVVLVFAYFNPLYPFSVGMIRLVARSRLNAYCNLNKHLCPHLVVYADDFSTKTCCESTSNTPFGYFETFWHDFNIAVLILHFFIYLIIVIMLEKRKIQNCLELIVKFKYKEPDQTNVNQTVKKDLVEDRLKTGIFDDAALIAQNLHKKYCNPLDKKGNVNAVKGISILAEKGKCLGILGPAGAGKSTTLRMLAGDIVMTKGNTWIDGCSVRRNRSKYINKVGLASNTGGVDPFMTGHENLVLINQLQGYRRPIAEKMTMLTLQYLGLTSYSNVEVRNYNRGCMRRLALCVVNVLSPEVALIDEPMRDSDPVTKPLITKALDRLLADRTTVIVAEASSDWRYMESIYDRVAIMRAGQLVAIGTPTNVLQELTSGYMVRFKLKVTAYGVRTNEKSQSNIGASDKKRSIIYPQGVEDFKINFAINFLNSVVTEEDVCMLTFFIKDPDKELLYSEMFTKLELMLYEHNNVIDHYTLSATTIEDVFMRMQRDRRDKKEKFINKST